MALIQQDPVLTARIFKVANSAAYGVPRHIDSLAQAIVFLGLHSVSGLAFTLSLQSGVFLDCGYEREVRGLWAHAIATAFYGKALASLMGENPDTAFLGGLLHSLGKLFVVHTVNWPRSGISRFRSKRRLTFINSILTIWPCTPQNARPSLAWLAIWPPPI